MQTTPPSRGRPAPELIAGLVAVVIWGVIGLGLLTGAGTGVARSTPTPSAAGTATDRPAATIEGGLVVLLRSSNARLTEQGQALDDLLGAESLDVPEVAAAVRQINATATFANGVLERLAGQPGGASIATALGRAYDAIIKQADALLALGLANESGYRKGAPKLVKLIADVPDVDRLVAAAAPTPTTVPTATARPSGSPKPTTAPTASPTPEPTAPPEATPTPEPTATPIGTPDASLGPNLLVNPGFEAGAAPWEFVLGNGASGSFTITDQDTASGDAAGMITLTGGVGPWSAASLRQGGLRLDNGTIYHVIVTARAAAPRDIRVRLTTPAGAVIGSRILTIGTTWTPVGFDVTAIGSVDDAVLLIETGLADGTVWLDDLAVAP